MVLADTRVGFAFGGLTGVTGGGASRVSVSSTEPKACFQLGSFGARINSANSAILTGLLNALGTGPLGIPGSATRAWPPATSTSSSSPPRSVSGARPSWAPPPFTYQQLAVAAATVLTQNGDTANADVLNSVATPLAGSGTVNGGQLFDVSQGGAAAASATINALDLWPVRCFWPTGRRRWRSRPGRPTWGSAAPA